MGDDDAIDLINKYNMKGKKCAKAAGKKLANLMKKTKSVKKKTTPSKIKRTYIAKK